MIFDTIRFIFECLGSIILVLFCWSFIYAVVIKDWIKVHEEKEEIRKILASGGKPPKAKKLEQASRRK
jgi:hypothetical protein